MPHNGQCGVSFESGGNRLLGRLWLAQGDDPKPTVVLLHGIPGIELNFDLAYAFREAGLNTLAFHFRGCWGSQGIYRIAAIPEDVRSAVDYLCSGRHPQVDINRLILFGHSLGGWAAVVAGAQDLRIRAVAVVAAICEPERFVLPEAVVQTDFLPYIEGYTKKRFDEDWQYVCHNLRPLEAVEKLAGRPVLVVYGRQDEAVPCSGSEALFHAAGEPKQLLVHEEANHSFTFHREWLKTGLLSWISTTGI